jgi:hypothetical protein
MSAIDELKKVKIPVWARWLGWYRARQRRKQARKEIYYVATVYCWTWWTDCKYYSSCYYICKEDGVGRRFYEYQPGSPLLKDREKSTNVYACIIVPWLLGSYSNQVIIDYAKASREQPVLLDK